MHRRLSCAIGCGLVLSATSLMLIAQADDGDEPITLFAKMMPVFAHPRCANCHGAVNPGRESPGAAFLPELPHEGGFIERGVSCTDACHDREPDWTRTAPPSLSFVGKNTRQLCKLQEQQAKALGTGPYLSHLSTDALIGAAFDGFRGGASNSADQPRMNRDDFVQAAAEWLHTGGGGCGSWAGTITQVEKFKASYGYPINVGTGPSTRSIEESATRTITITLKDGEATAQSTMSGHQTIQTVMRAMTPNGPCTTTVTGNSDWSGTNSGAATVRVNIAPDGKYTIRFKGPEEKTRGGGNMVSTGDCGPNMSDPPSSPVELEWSAKDFTIHGQLADPRERRYLKNDITSDGTNARYPKAWLAVSPVGTTRVDSGDRIPISVEITWDLALVE